MDSESEYEYLQLDNEQEQVEARGPNRFKPRIEFQDYEFKERFRLTPRQAEILLNRIGPNLNILANTNHALSEKQMLLCALRFYAGNDFYYDVADSHGMHKSTVMKAVKRCTLAILQTLGHLISWPNSEDECREISQKFAALCKIPMIAGAVDGSLIRIHAPKKSHGTYRDRYGHNAINVIGVTDTDCRFLYFSAQGHGSWHDQRVLRKTVGLKFYGGWRPFPGAVLLGDSAYAATDWVVPMRQWNPENELARRFYTHHAKGRVVVEMAFGRWKNRWQCLRNGQLRFKTKTTTNMTDRNQPQEEDRIQDETDSDDGLWNEFESCATSVTQLYRNCNWRTLQSAAASTTQLYKNGLEQKKRSFDRGFTKGRLSLARELSTMCRYKNKVDVGDIVALLSKYDLLPPANEGHHGHGHPHHHRQGGGQSPRQRGGGNANNEGNPAGGNVAVAGGQLDNGIAGNPNAVFIFQEALAPVAANPSASPHRSGLGNFLQTQVYRHRKRQHSPGGGGGAGSPCHGGFEFVSKRFKRL